MNSSKHAHETLDDPERRRWGLSRSDEEGTRSQTARRSCPVAGNGGLRIRGTGGTDFEEEATAVEPSLWRVLKDIVEEHRNGAETDFLEDLKKMVKSRTNEKNDKSKRKERKTKTSPHGHKKQKRVTGEQKRGNPPGGTVKRRRRNRNPSGGERGDWTRPHGEKML